MSIEQGGRLGAQNKMKLFLETLFDISFFPHNTNVFQTWILAQKFKYLKKKQKNSFRQKWRMYILG